MKNKGLFAKYTMSLCEEIIKYGTITLLFPVDGVHNFEELGIQIPDIDPQTATMKKVSYANIPLLKEFLIISLGEVEDCADHKFSGIMIDKAEFYFKKFGKTEIPVILLSFTIKLEDEVAAWLFRNFGKYIHIKVVSQQAQLPIGESSGTGGSGLEAAKSFAEDLQKTLDDDNNGIEEVSFESGGKVVDFKKKGKKTNIDKLKDEINDLPTKEQEAMKKVVKECSDDPEFKDTLKKTIESTT